MILVLDRIEGEIAVLLCGGQPIELPAALLPTGAAEGDTLSMELSLLGPDEARRAALGARLGALSEGADGGDFSL